MTTFARGPYSLTVVAESGEQLADFTPYVAAIDDRGWVFFTAALADGGSGVFRCDGTQVTAVAELGADDPWTVCSHPDSDGRGAVCFYAETTDGGSALLRAHDGEIVELADAAGPLGPTVNARGTIAFRAPVADAGEGIFTIDSGSVTPVADTTDGFSAFQGLPVIDARGRTVFRADSRDGREGIYALGENGRTTVVETGDRFESLGFFPFSHDAESIVFCGTSRTQGPGVYLACAGSVTRLVGADAGFESFRGALLNGAGELVYYATPTGGALGIYTGPDIECDCLLGVGRTLLDSTVAGFALNPVSINSSGQLAIRVALESGRQLILQADPG